MILEYGTKLRNESIVNPATPFATSSRDKKGRRGQPWVPFPEDGVATAQHEMETEAEAEAAVTMVAALPGRRL